MNFDNILRNLKRLPHTKHPIKETLARIVETRIVETYRNWAEKLPFSLWGITRP